MDAFLATLDPWLVYLVVGSLTFGESAAFLGLLLPGEIALVGAAAVAVGIDPVTLAIVAALCSALGGWAGYGVGRRYGNRLVAWEPVRRRLPSQTDDLLGTLATGRRALTLVIFSRFNQVTRAAVPVLAGISPMQPARFMVASTLGAVLWGSSFTAIGFFAAEWWERSSGPIQVILTASLTALAGGWFALSGRRDK